MSRLISLIIPCCNEEQALGRFPDRLFPVLSDLVIAGEQRVELILVDDGSRDRTWEMLQELSSKTLPFQIVLGQHPINRGLGAALKTGHQLARGELVVTLDVDGTYPFEIAVVLIAAIDRGADIATASPYHPQGKVDGVSGLRLLFSRGASTLYRILVDRSIHTYTAMVRAYRAEVLDEAIADDPGFLHVAKTLVEARRRGAIVIEVPAVLSQREVGQSKAKLLRITRAHLGYMRQLTWLRMSRRFWLANSSATAPAEVIAHG